MMTKQEAAAVLRQHDTEDHVGALYDDEPELREALACLIPGFDYPEWEAVSLRQILRRFAGQSWGPGRLPPCPHRLALNCLRCYPTQYHHGFQRMP